MLYDVASQRYGVVESKGLICTIGSFFGFENAIDLFFGIASGFGEKNGGPINDRCFDILETIAVVDVRNIILELIEEGLFGRQKFLHAG